jgi:transcriptional regulator with XRE-family HTH domain
MDQNIDGLLRENLVRFRELKGWTQTELGKRAGIAPASVSHFETGQRTPSLETLVKVANALTVSLDRLVGRAPEFVEPVDPIFMAASRADASTLETVKRVAAALLAEANNKKNHSQS